MSTCKNVSFVDFLYLLFNGWIWNCFFLLKTYFSYLIWFWKISFSTCFPWFIWFIKVHINASLCSEDHILGQILKGGRYKYTIVVPWNLLIYVWAKTYCLTDNCYIISHCVKNFTQYFFVSILLVMVFKSEGWKIIIW